MSDEGQVLPATEAAPVEAPNASPAGGATSPVPDSPPTDAGDAAGGAPDQNKVYTQEEVDRIAAKIKKNERYRTKREVEAYYQGRMEQATPAAAAAPAAPEPAAQEEKPPSRDQYESYEAYLEARAEYEAEQKANAERETATKRTQSFQSKLLEKYPDIQERAADIAHVVIPGHMVEAMHESDFGTDLLNEFVSNPKELERIAALSPSAALREIGRLEARLESAAGKPTPSATPAAPTPSRAPTPIKAVGGSTVSTDDEPSHDKPDQWKAWRDRQVAKAKRTGTSK